VCHKTKEKVCDNEVKRRRRQKVCLSGSDKDVPDIKDVQGFHIEQM